MRVQVKSAKDVVWHAICRTSDKKGRTPLEVRDFSAMLVTRNEATSGAIGDHATTHLLFSLQKEGLIRFREVGQGTSSKQIVDIRLTDKGLSARRKWTLAVKEHSHNYVKKRPRHKKGP